MTARTAIASTVPEPHGKPGGPGAFHIKGANFPPYIEHVAGELLKKIKDKSRAYQMAIGIVRDWAQGHDGHGNKVSADVQAAAVKAIAAYDALRARAKATPNKGHNLAAGGHVSAFDLAAMVKGKDGKTRAVDTPAEMRAARNARNAGSSSGDFNSKHPRGSKGTPIGGRFVPLGSARNQQAAKAQKAPGAKKEYRSALTATGAQRLGQLKKMTPQQLATLSRAAYSYKSSDPAVVKLRVAVANELARRGYDVKDFGALGGGINSDKKLPTQKAVKVGAKRPSARKRRAAARSAKATTRTPVKGAPKPVSMSAAGTAGVDLAKLSAAQRKNLQPSQFAVPGKDAYPIPDRAHAIAALSRVAQHGTPAEKARVKAAIRKKFPQLMGGGSE